MNSQIPQMYKFKDASSKGPITPKTAPPTTDQVLKYPSLLGAFFIQAMALPNFSFS